MKILGMHFGHDAGVSLVEDGKVVFLAHSERLTRVKKTVGLSYSGIKSILDRAGISVSDIDHCAVTTTQGVDIVLDRRFPFSIELARHPSDTIPSTLEKMATQQGLRSHSDFLTFLDPVGALVPARRQKRIGAVVEELRIPAEDASVVATLNRYWFDENSPINKPAGLKHLSDDWHASTDHLASQCFNFHYPITVSLDGRTIPGSMINHHAGHAAATFYQSPFASAAIFTLDGGANIQEGGMFWYGNGNEIWPVRTHFLTLGVLYPNIAIYNLKLGGSAEGKMMGLAPYGQPTFFDERFVGNSEDTYSHGKLDESWRQHIVERIKADPARYDVSALGAPERMTEAINADFAASTQKLFEETMMASVRQLSALLGKLGVDASRIALSGGCMLNCPTNTRISQETDFKQVFVEPACDDGGLPAGVALWTYYNLMNQPRSPVHPVRGGGLPYLGLPLKADDVDAAIARAGATIRVQRPDDVAAESARRLAAGQVLGWFQGRSEVGPRALGHRSIVADPRSIETWNRVNTIKGRELWRPLAPSVLEEHATTWFKNMPAHSPFMMFVGDVVRDDVQAIAHVDNTARVQTVSPECGRYYDLISAFHELTGCAVVLNTSMNGPGQPIAEYPDDAIALLRDGRFDTLVMEDRIIERAG